MLEEPRDEHESPSSSELLELPEHEPSDVESLDCDESPEQDPSLLESLASEELPEHDSSPSAALESLESPEQEPSLLESLSALEPAESPEHEPELSDSCVDSLLPEHESSSLAEPLLQPHARSLSGCATTTGSAESSGSGATTTTGCCAAGEPFPFAGGEKVATQPELSMRAGRYQGPVATPSAKRTARTVPGVTIAVARVSQEFWGASPASASAKSSESAQRRTLEGPPSPPLQFGRAGQGSGSGVGSGQLVANARVGFAAAALSRSLAQLGAESSFALRK